ncbi:MAG: ferrous iron transport protein A [Erysipelotrichaceae bacterium]|nr:ferrous iron transport protein A [Erysipelotrichaceae bacterium]
MIPLIFAQTGQVNSVKKIGGSPEIKRHLKNLGFTVGGPITVITSLSGNIIVNVKETRVAISRDMAQKIMV